MSNTDNAISNAVIVGRLSIERCQAHLAHLHALMHLCAPAALGMDGLVAESVLRVMQDLEGELMQSARAMSMVE